MLKVVVIGYGPMGLGLVKGVLASTGVAKLVAVFPWSKMPKKRVGVVEACEKQFRNFLKQNHISLIHAKSVNSYEFMEYLKKEKPDIILVGSWGELLKPHVLQAEGVRFINCHPSLLPMHRGPNPYTAVILSGDQFSGISFHEMDEKIDTGPLLLQKSVAIDETDTGFSLREKCAQLAEQSVLELLTGIQSGVIQPQAQTAEGSYDAISPLLGEINWKNSPEFIERQSRALYPWLPVYGFVEGQLVGFTKGQVVSISTAQSASHPGVILSKNKAGILVSTIEPGKAMQLEKPFLYEYPPWISRFLVGQKLVPGYRFAIPSD